MTETEAQTEAVEATDEEEELDLPERYHKPECPMDPDRLEWHTVVATTGKNAGLEVEVVRCPDCGGQIEKVVDKED